MFEVSKCDNCQNGIAVNRLQLPKYHSCQNVITITTVKILYQNLIAVKIKQLLKCDSG